MNSQLDLRIITKPYSEVYWGYLRRLVFGNLLTKHNKLSRFSYSVVIFPAVFSTYCLVIMLKPSRFPTSDWALCNWSAQTVYIWASAGIFFWNQLACLQRFSCFGKQKKPYFSLGPLTVLIITR